MFFSIEKLVCRTRAAILNYSTRFQNSWKQNQFDIIKWNPVQIVPSVCIFLTSTEWNSLFLLKSESVFRTSEKWTGHIFIFSKPVRQSHTARLKVQLRRECVTSTILTKSRRWIVNKKRIQNDHKALWVGETWRYATPAASNKIN